MRKKNFLKNDHARIPFSVIGIFLILGSSFTSVYVTNLETQKANEISKTIDFNEIESFLRLAEADLAAAINFAGMKGLKEIGEKPVTSVEGYQDDNPYGTTSDEVNKNRVRSMIMEDMNIYLKNSYTNGKFTNGRFIINVQIPEGEEYPLLSRDEITFNFVDMELYRDFSINEIGPPKRKNHRTYWIANLAVDVDILKVNSDGSSDLVLNRTIDVSTIITCRYSLLKALVDEYQDEIGGSFWDGTENSLFTVLTGFFNAYSLARGLMHYYKGDPKNVVDNDDLDLMANIGLLMQQGFVFGSVDPMALVGLATSMGSSESDAKTSVSDDLLNPGGGFTWDIDPSDITSVIPEDDGSGQYTTDIVPDIDIAEIAMIPLYEVNSILLCYQNDAELWSNETRSEPTEEDIEDLSQEKLDQGYYLVESKNNPADISENQNTKELIREIIKTVYSTDMELHVERGNNLISKYLSDGYIIQSAATPYISTPYNFNGSIEKPDFGSIQSGDILYGEFYYVNQEEVLIKIILNKYSEYDIYKNDIKDIFYENIDLDDENLQDTIDKYKNWVITDSNLSEWLDDKTVTGLINVSTLYGDYNSWVEAEAWQALNDIYEEIIKIELDPSITFTEYPDPFSLMRAAEEDLLGKYRQKMDDYLDIQNYKEGSLFISTGKKAVYCARYWYVYKIEQDIDEYYSNLGDSLNDVINNELEERGVDGSAEAVSEVLNGPAMDALKDQINIPMGYDITLKNKWTESIKIAIDQKPDYLKPDEIIKVTAEENKLRDEEFYSLKLRNTCTLGPTGFPFLPPTPLTPWIFTFNIWIIDVHGEYEEFKVVDATDETHFHPYFGHEAQIYVRKHEAIKEGEKIIGENTRLNFALTTLAFAFVPPGGRMVGDTEDDLIEETDGW